MRQVAGNRREMATSGGACRRWSHKEYTPGRVRTESRIPGRIERGAPGWRKGWRAPRRFGRREAPGRCVAALVVSQPAGAPTESVGLGEHAPAFDDLEHFPQIVAALLR